MKIVFARHTLLNRGGDKMVVAQANYLAGQGHDVFFRVKNVSSIFTLHDSIRFMPFRLPGKLGTLLSCLLFREQADVVVADIIPLACLLFLRNGKKVIYYAQDYDESYYHRWWQKLFIRLLYFLGLSLFRVPTIAVAEPLGLLLKERFHAAVSVVENGVDTAIFHRRPDNDLLEMKKYPAIVVLARDDLRKGFDLARIIINDLAKERNDFEVWTVGMKCPGAFPTCHHRDFGYVDELKLSQILSSADIFLFPTRHEGFPLMALEAFACGCAVVTTDAVHCAEDDVNALVAPVGDVRWIKKNVSRLLSDAALREKLAVAGMEEASRRKLSAALGGFSRQICQPR